MPLVSSERCDDALLLTGVVGMCTMVLGAVLNAAFAEQKSLALTVMTYIGAIAAAGALGSGIYRAKNGQCNQPRLSNSARSDNNKPLIDPVNDPEAREQSDLTGDGDGDAHAHAVKPMH